jgi:hypothetical protein
MAENEQKEIEIIKTSLEYATFSLKKRIIEKIEKN